MRKYFSWLAFAFLFLTTGASFVNAQAAFSFNTEDAKSHATEWMVSFSKSSGFSIGDVFEIKFQAHISDQKWHIYSSRPASGGYNPTEFFLVKKESKDIEKAGEMKEDKEPYEYDDNILDASVRYHKEHDVTFSQKFKITGAHPKLVGALSYQICIDPDNGGMCMFPSLDFTFEPETGAPAQTTNNPDSQEAVSVDTSGKSLASIPGNQNCKDCLKEWLKRAATDTSNFCGPEASGSVLFTGSLLPSKYPKKGNSSEKDCDDSNIWLLFLQSFLFGFVAVLTPCVFPMIPMTVSFFTKQSSTRQKGIRNALIYSSFIIFIYTALGITVSIAFGPDFLYKMSTNPWVNLAFFGLLFVFALSFLGLFEITLPSSWSTALDAKSERGGMIGIFFMALTLSVASFSCTGPLVGTALINAASGCSIWGPILSMLGFSSAIAIPFGLLAVFPGWMNSMPKSGGWLNAVKVVMGFVELALGLKFLSQSDQVEGWGLLDREIYIALWIVISIALALYLLGIIRLPHDSPSNHVPVPQLILGMASLAFALYLVPGLWGAKLQNFSGLLPPPNSDIGVHVLGQKEMNPGTLNGKICELENRKYFEVFEEFENHGYCTFYDLDEALDYSRKNNLPLFVDFTGRTCANCRLMEQKVWSKRKIEKILKKDYVMVSLFADDKTDLEDPEKIGNKRVYRLGQKWYEIQNANYGTIAQPFYVLMDHDGENLAPPRGYNANVNEYADWLNEGLKEFNRRRGEGGEETASSEE